MLASILEFVGIYSRWFVAAHLLFVVFWLAGLFYLPRLYVYHTQWLAKNPNKDATHKLFCLMEARLVRVIMTPAFFLAWGFGLLLLLRSGFWQNVGGWMHWKLLLVIGLSVYHFWLLRLRHFLAQGETPLGEKSLRYLNEIGPITSAVIIFFAIVKFF